MTTKPETTLQSDMTGAAVSDILVRFADAQEAMGGGCSDGYCVVKRHEGMHTNGGCRCLYQPDWSQTQRAGQALRIAQEMVGEIERLRARVAELETGLEGLITTYDREVFMRSADMHCDDCKCLRCALDRARALLKGADE